eukprot:4589772-Pleurochrysis_carterae.AAC.2
MMRGERSARSGQPSMRRAADAAQRLASHTSPTYHGGSVWDGRLAHMSRKADRHLLWLLQDVLPDHDVHAQVRAHPLLHHRAHCDDGRAQLLPAGRHLPSQNGPTALRVRRTRLLSLEPHFLRGLPPGR